MDGSENSRIRPPYEEPDYLRRARDVGEAWDHLAGVIVGIFVLVAILILGILLLINPELRSPAVGASLGPVILLLAGFAFRRRSK